MINHVRLFLELNHKQLNFIPNNKKLIKTKFYFKSSYSLINAKLIIYCMLVNYMRVQSLIIKKKNKFLMVECISNTRSSNSNMRMQIKNANNRYLINKPVFINRRITSSLVFRPSLLDYQYLPVTSQTTLIRYNKSYFSNTLST